MGSYTGGSSICGRQSGRCRYSRQRHWRTGGIRPAICPHRWRRRTSQRFVFRVRPCSRRGQPGGRCRWRRCRSVRCSMRRRLRRWRGMCGRLRGRYRRRFRLRRFGRYRRRFWRRWLHDRGRLGRRRLRKRLGLRFLDRFRFRLRFWLRLNLWLWNRLVMLNMHDDTYLM